MNGLLQPPELMMRKVFLVCCFWFLSSPSSILLVRGDDLLPAENSWYTRYPDYPEYCSTTSQMSTRAIPPLRTSDPRVGETRLLHVSAIQRHGARTPIMDDYGDTCWEGYRSSPSTGVWDCELTTYSSPPIDSGNDDTTTMVVVEFDKVYDALKFPKHGLSNEWNGTCQTGQLLLQGYHQVYSNGRHLRNAYVYDEDRRQDHDVRMRLIDASGKKFGTKPWDESNLYFRSDDDERTLLSGQLLVNGMLHEEIKSHNENHNRKLTLKIHTADREKDILDINEQICPRLTYMRQKIEKSRSFRQFNNSKEANTLRRFMKNELNVSMEIDIHECLMPVICTDRDLPTELEWRGLDFLHERRNLAAPSQNEQDIDYDVEAKEKNKPSMKRYGSQIFKRMTTFNAARELLYYRSNSAEYAKLGMAPLWAEIIEDNIAPVLHGDKDPKVKLALYSGHDDTIMPLLASLGPDVWTSGTWPSYAGLVLLEIHELVDGQTDRTIFKSKYAFRLLYNGRVITHRVMGCPVDDGSDSGNGNCELCDLQILLNIVEPFANKERGGESKSCRLPPHARLDNGGASHVNLDEIAQRRKKKHGHHNNRRHNAWTLTLSVISGLLIGAMIAVIRDQKRSRSLRHELMHNEYNKEQDGIMLTSTPFTDRADNDNYDDEPTQNGGGGYDTVITTDSNDDDENILS